MDNFIYYCDSMMIANEGIKEGFQKVQSWLITQFNKLLDLLQKAVTHFKNRNAKRYLAPGPIAGAMQQLIARCKAGLSKSKALNSQNPELANKLKQEVSDISEEYKTIKAQMEKALATGIKGTAADGKEISKYERRATEREVKTYGKRIDRLNKSSASEALTSLMI